MRWTRWFAVNLIGATITIGNAYARDIRITLPKRSQTTPVQRLNREGVEAVHKHSYTKAEELFYKAYLLDPDDPFTLNNLGYIAELQGQIDRALRFYELSAQQHTDAVIDLASTHKAVGQSVNAALATQNPLMRVNSMGVNHDNVEAVRLLSQGRAPEVDMLLQQTLKRDPGNVFTLNNMGVAKEMEGESQDALKFYDAAAAVQSNAAAVVTVNHSWRGKPVTEMAAQNGQKLRKRLATEQTVDVQVAALNLRGVSAFNRNDLRTADQDFRNAYAIAPSNAFTLNNIGYMAEIEGDRETAQYFYDKAKTVADPKATIGLATRRSAEGLKLAAVASDSDSKVQAKVDQERDLYRSEHEPILLRRRDNSIVNEPNTPSTNSEPQSTPPSN